MKKKNYKISFLSAILLFFHVFSLPLTSSAETSAAELAKIDHDVVSVHGVLLAVAKYFEKKAIVGNDVLKVGIFISPPNLSDPSYMHGLLRVRVLGKSKDYSLNDELRKTEEEWAEYHNVETSPSLTEIYKRHPLEEAKNEFSLGVGHLVNAKIKSNPSNFVLFSYAAESKSKAIIITLFSLGRDYPDVFKKNKKAFDLVAGSVP